MTIDEFIGRYGAGLEEISQLPRQQALRAYERLAACFHKEDQRIGWRDDCLAGVAVRRFMRHQPPTSRCLAPVVYLHGGGWTLGSPGSHHAAAEGLALELGREVISVDYRLMPEASYDRTLQDCLDVVSRCAPAVLAGDSAGGRLAIDTAFRYRQTGSDIVLGLIYPVVDVPHLDLLGADAPLFSRADVMSAWQLIAEQAPAQSQREPPASRIEVLSVQRDPLSPMIARAASRWRSQGARVGEHMAPGMVHSALQARTQLTAMALAWQRFCRALDAQDQQPPLQP
ncbi:alpha/beta hydrolase fold domain-containing protein [Halomonas cupida]|uniref:alpha/beta hydrolase fold domain-containing protein n=1 Tax=Halomonas cupida TaxID=44933 RepID=UPI003A926D48